MSEYAAKTQKWYFDDYVGRRGGKKSWVQLSDISDEEPYGGGKRLDVYMCEENILTISGDLDQWGTYISLLMEKDYGDAGTVKAEATIAQEWSTKSFVQSLIAGLTEFAKICDLECNTEAQRPEYVEEIIAQSTNGK